MEQSFHSDAGLRKSVDNLTESRAGHAKDTTALDDLKSYGEITEAHADGIKKLVTVFSSLYSTMSDAQKNADNLFRHGDSDHDGAKAKRK